MSAVARALRGQSCEAPLLDALAKNPTSVVVAFKRENPDGSTSWGVESFAEAYEWPMLIALLERRMRHKLDEAIEADGEDW